jgi:hypothetical protein
MTKLIVIYREGDAPSYVNINADSIINKDGFMFAYAGHELVGAFDMGVVDMVYLSEEGGK